MTKAELIKKLENYPDDCLIMIVREEELEEENLDEQGMVGLDLIKDHTEIDVMDTKENHVKAFVLTY